MKLWRYGRPIEELGQRYRLDGMLGSGGMADVCLAWDEREGRETAVKILKSDDLDQETLNRFMKEAAQIAGWQHPNILRIYESMQIELIDPVQGSVLFYMVMEYARGGDLQKRLAPGKPFPLSASFALFRQLCEAVQYAHTHGIIHRDLKPLNILFRRPKSGPEEVVLSDFGLAVQIDASHHTFARGGTLAYMAPEQFQGNALPASDIFALGVIIYQLCTGHLPFRRAIQDLPRLLSTPAPLPMRPSLLNSELPPALDEVLLCALRELPSERHRSAQELWDAISLALLVGAPTFPIENDAWYAAGQTWPSGKTDQSSASPASSITGHSRDLLSFSPPSLSQPAALVTPTEEGPVSELGSVREKQKASPGVVPGASLPNHSIHALPNHRGQFAPNFSKPLPDWPEVMPDASRKNTSSARAHPKDVSLARIVEPEIRSVRRALPSASASGSTTLSGSPQIPPRASAKRATPDTLARADAAPSTKQFSTGRGLAKDGAVLNAKDTRASNRAPLTPNDSAVNGAARARGTARGGGMKRVLPLTWWRAGRRLPLVPTLTTLALLVLLAAIFLAASAQTPLLHLLNAPVTTVTLTPRSQLVQQNLTLTAVPAAPDPAHNQIQARTLTATSPTQSATANTSGSIQGKRATGQLTFINNGSTPITIQSTTISGHSGVQVSFTGPITIPAVPPSSAVVTGFAVNAGTAGNIPVLDIVEPCCATNIVVKNTTIFTGGQDAQPNSVIEQKDIDGAASAQETALKQGVLNGLRGQVRGNERLLDGSPQCQPQVNADHKVGDVAKSVTVQVALTCSEGVYDYTAAQRIALRELQQSVNSNPTLGASFALDGQLVLNLLTATPAGTNNAFTLSMQAHGLWVYTISQATLRQLVTQIAGKSQNDASTLLMQQAGIVAVHFSTPGTLPVNTGEIQLVLKLLPGVTPTSTP